MVLVDIEKPTASSLWDLVKANVESMMPLPLPERNSLGPAMRRAKERQLHKHNYDIGSKRVS